MALASFDSGFNCIRASPLLSQKISGCNEDLAGNTHDSVTHDERKEIKRLGNGLLIVCEKLGYGNSIPTVVGVIAIKS